MSKRMPVIKEEPKARIAGAYSPEEIMQIIAKHCKCKPIVIGKKNKHYVFFTPHAWDEFAAITHYGKWVAENELECIYFLEGYFFNDDSNRTSTVVTNVISPPSATQKRTFAQLCNEEFNAYDFVNKSEEILQKYSGTGLDNADKSVINPFFNSFKSPIRVGFGHTHPDLGVFFSGTDKNSVFAVAGEPWITMVADPRREELLITVGKDLKKATSVFFEKHINAIKENTAQRIVIKEQKSETDLRNEALNMLLQQLLLPNRKLALKLHGRMPGKIKFKGCIIGRK